MNKLQNPIRAIIVDDESAFHQTITNLLSKQETQIRIVGFARSVREGIDLIKQEKPDLVFLDIKLPDGTGFDILTAFENIPFNLIFTTAYDQFAIEAFHFSAVDYLMKPIDPDLLWAALARVAETVEKSRTYERLSVLAENLETTNQLQKKMVLKDIDTMHIVKLKEIEYCEAQGSYTRFFLVNNKEILVSRSLIDFEDMLANSGFMRSHRSYIINLERVVQLERTGGITTVMESGKKLPVSIRKKEKVIQHFERLT